MLKLAESVKVYLACGSTDMRKSIDGLAVIVQESFKLDPFSTALYVFCNKGCNKLKILQWEHNGFWLHYRRLEKGKFKWSRQNQNQLLDINRRELNWLLDGLSIEQAQAHKEVKVEKVV
ncbi:MAG: IS66 family insertion sequence element accessory protein TnpB [Firmicutes bacterium]|nr:IS66 family insertion sequence element accessory protein TnpB [Bacillota bacterium]